MKNNITIRDLQILRNIATTGSLSACASDMGIAQANISKALTHLEEKTGLKIFERTVRPVKLTVFGMDLLPHVNHYLNTYDELVSFVDYYKRKPSGVVEINAPSGQLLFLSRHVLPQLQLTHPEIRIRLVTSNLDRSEFIDGARFNPTCDILFTHTRPLNEDLVAKKIASVGTNIYGTPGMLQKNPVENIGSYSRVPCIIFLSLMNQDANILRFENTMSGENVNVSINGNYVCDNALTALELARSGLGYVYMPDYLVKEMGYDQFLVPTLPPNYISEMNVYMIYKQRTQQPFRVELVIQAIMDMARKNLKYPL